jgi:hypothetical protein
MTSDTLRRPITSLLVVMMVVSISTTVALLIRFYVVEPEAFAAACAAGVGGFRCLVRQLTVAGFLHDAFGMTSLACGVIATIARWRWLAVIAMIAGAVGAVFYRFELSGAGLLLGALVWVRAGKSAPRVPEQIRGN